MRKLVKIRMLVLVFFTFFVATAQEQATKKVEIEKVESTFSVEINADTTLDDLAFIKKTLNTEFNTEFNFQNVQFIDNKMVGLKVTLKNEKQSYMKSIANGTKPITPFTITLKTINDEDYQIVMDQVVAFKDFNPSFLRPSDSTSNFLKMKEEMSAMKEEMQSMQQRILKLFDDFNLE